MANNATVLVTGGSGFIAAHCILQLLQAGYRVRTTVRNLAREPEVRAILQRGGTDGGAQLTFFAADLEKDSGWAEAVAGCEFVLHVASPFPPTMPKDDDALIRPAREGALRVLRAARDAGVKRVVLTSSFAAIGYGHPPRTQPFDETSWTNVDGGQMTAYVKSKTLAERAAWDFLAKEGGTLELSTVNPVAVLGPVLAKDYSSSILIVEKLMNGALPGSPRVALGLVDVRDVADLHLRAMTHPAAKGERFLAVAGDFLWMGDMARLLKEQLGAAARRVPTRGLPDFLVRAAALFDPTVKQILPDLGHYKTATSEKARRLLGWTPRSAAEAMKATAESLIALGLVRK